MQDGWDRRGRPPAVLVEGNWALLTCTPGREGPTGGRDRLQLVKLHTRGPNAPQVRNQSLWLFQKAMTFQAFASILCRLVYTGCAVSCK